MSKGLGSRQCDILAKLADHCDNPPDYDRRIVRWHGSHRGVPAEGDQVTLRHADGTGWILGTPEYGEVPEWRRDRYPEWMTIDELAGKRGVDLGGHPITRGSDVEATRRAVRTLEAAGLVETRMIHRNNHGQRQIGCG